MAKELKDAVDSIPGAPPVQVVQVNLQELAGLVASVVSQAMTEVMAKAGNLQMDVDKLGQVMGQAVSDGIAKNTRPKLKIGDYIARGGHSAFHPKPRAETPVLTRSCFQNGVLMQHPTLTDKEVTLLNRIDRSGRYINRLVEVRLIEEGPDAVLHVNFNCKTPDQVLELKGYIRNFEDILQQVVDAQAQDRKKEAEPRQERHFGGGQYTREAEQARQAKGPA